MVSVVWHNKISKLLSFLCKGFFRPVFFHFLDFRRNLANIKEMTKSDYSSPGILEYVCTHQLLD